MDMVAIQDDGDREDGEIVDDFEDISDCSIPSVGKCDNELLRAISLSSISDSGDERSVHTARQDSTRSPEPQLLEIDEHRNTRRTQHRKRKRKHRQHNDVGKRHFSPQVFVDLAADSSSSNEESHQVDQDMLRKLKEAVHIEGPNEHHNSLRSRLKAMIHNVPPSDSEDEEIETLRTLALLSNSKAEENDEKAEPELVDILDDRELLELRSAALKSAVLKKHQDRKKRKELIVDAIVDNIEVNKENTATNDIAKDVDNNKEPIEKDTKQKNTDSSTITPLQENGEENKDTSIEEDVDIMRAKLLESMSKKITNQNIPTVKPRAQQPPIKKQLVAPTNRNNALIRKSTFALPPVKPLIININNDSDSESDVKSPTKKRTEDPISQSVTEFLKLRRQQFEATEFINVHSGNPPSNGLLLNTNTNREIKIVPKVSTKEISLHKDLSGVKLLSKAQQREYQLLKKKLLLAKQKKLIERIKSSEVKRLEHVQKTPHTLKETLADLQFRENGRLRVKGKYDSLAGLLQLVNGASVERQRCEARMKRLLHELTVAKGQLGQTHRKFTDLVQKLIREKNNIDARFTKIDTSTKFTITVPIVPTIASNLLPTAPVISVVTSTPIKALLHESKLKISDIISETNALVLENGTSGIILDNETNELHQNIENESNELARNVMNADEILSTETKNCADAFPPVHESLKYISPLDNRSSTSDPHGTICPYELFGDCKDASCKFVHCGKS